MRHLCCHGHSTVFKRMTCLVTAFVFCFSLVLPPSTASAQFLPSLPLPGAMVVTSPGYVPTLIKGIRPDPVNPLQFSFLVDTGNSDLQGEAFDQETLKLIRYFLAALTVPEDEMWVNLSPYEGDRIIPPSFGMTEMGMDLLSQDYLLKQLTASLMYPEEDLGKKFWDRVHKRVKEEFGNVEIPMATFNKIWIVPKDAVVYEYDGAAYVVKSTLKVMLEEDYLALKSGLNEKEFGLQNIEEASAKKASGVSSQVIREILIPEIEKEVNEGQNFSRLRQIYNSMVLATWYKVSLKESLLSTVYVDQNKVKGIDIDDPAAKDKIYEQYLQAFRQGVYDYIKEDYDPDANQVIPRRYFSGGFDPNGLTAGVSAQRVSGRPESLRGPVAQMVRQGMQGVEGATRSWRDIGLVENATPEAVEDVSRPTNAAVLRFQETALDDFFQRSGGKKVVADVSLEAFLPELQGLAQNALGKGGLGFLTGETWGAYRDLRKFSSIGVMPLYEYFQEGQDRTKIDWEKEPGVKRVMIRNDRGEVVPLSFNVEFNHTKEYPVDIYWVNRNGTPVFLIRQPKIFENIYPDGTKQIIQYGFIGRAFVEFIKTLKISPDIVRLSEPQMMFVAVAMQNDRNFYESLKNGEKSAFDASRIVMTTHTPEKAALPVFYDVNWIRGALGDDLVPDSIVIKEGNSRVVNAAEALAQMAAVINGVSLEHAEVTKRLVLPNQRWKTTGVQNGSDPKQWYSPQLASRIHQKGVEGIEGQDLFEAGQQAKEDLNQWLGSKGYNQFTDLSRPTFGALRRLVEYKEQGLLLELVRWITGDRDKEYDTPWGKRKGLGSNLFIGGPGRDGAGQDWARRFRDLQSRPEFKGKLVFIPDTGVDIMRLAVSASDFWLVLPRHTREASGTSDQRAGFNGHKVIATATGGPLDWVVHGQNGWLIDVFKDWSLDDVIRGFENRDSRILDIFHREAQRQLGDYMTEAAQQYYDYVEKRSDLLLKGMEGSFRSAHQRVNIHTMVREYGRLFEAVLKGTGASGFESRQVAANSNERVIDHAVEAFTAEMKIKNVDKEKVKRLFEGTGNAFDVVASVQEAAEVSREEAEEVASVAWLMAAYDLNGGASFSEVRQFLKQEGPGRFSEKLSELNRERLISDQNDLKRIFAKETELRKIDANRSSENGVNADYERAVRQELASAWQSIADRREIREQEMVNSAVLGRAPSGTGERVPVGGIDLNPKFLDLQIRRDDRGIPLPLPEQPIEQMHIDGFVPIIINTTPVQTLPFLLGSDEGPGQDADRELSQMIRQEQEALVL